MLRNHHSGKKYLIIVLILLLITPISIAESENISFVDGNQGLVFQIGYLKQGANISIKSDMGLSENVTVRISDLSTTAGYRIQSSKLISELPAPRNIPFGKDELFSIKFKEYQSAPPGIYSGKLIATSSNAGTITKDFTLIVPSNGDKFTVLTEEITINGTNWIPSWIPFISYTEFSEKSISFGRKDALYTQLPNLSVIISNGGGREGRVVFQTENAEFNDGYVVIPLKVEGISSSGKYSGTLYLDPTDPKKSDKVNIVVIVNDHLIWPFLFIFIGVMISYGLTDWWNDGRLRMKLQDKIWSLNKEALMRQRSFAQENEFMPYTHFDVSRAIKLRLDDLEKDLKEIIDATELTSIKSEVDTIDNCLKEFTPFLIQAAQVFNKFIFYDEVLVKKGEKVEPIFFQDIRNLLVGQQIFVFKKTGPNEKTEIEILNGKLKDTEIFLDSFYSTFIKLSELESIISFLSCIPIDKWDKSERVIFDGLKKNIEQDKYSEKLRNVKDNLWKAGTLTDLHDPKIEGTINDLALRILNIGQVISGSKRYKDFKDTQELKNLQDQPTKKLFWNRQWKEIKLTPDTYAWLNENNTTNADIEKILKDIENYIKEKNNKIESLPEIIRYNTDVEIWSDLGFLPIEGRQIIPFEWFIYSKSEKSNENPNGTLIKIPGWDWVVPSTKTKFKKPGNYTIELRLGQKSLIRQDIQVKRMFCWIVAKLLTMMKRLNNEIHLDRADFPTALASLLVSMAVILITSIFGITLLYSGDGFGSSKDYLVALIWGSTADQATKLFIPILGKITK